MDPMDGNAAYLEALYEDHLKDPFALPEEWRAYFSALHLEAWRRRSPEKGEAPKAEALPIDAEFYLKVARLREAYRMQGHLAAGWTPWAGLAPGRRSLAFSTTVFRRRTWTALCRLLLGRHLAGASLAPRGHLHGKPRG